VKDLNLAAQMGDDAGGEAQDPLWYGSQWVAVARHASRLSPLVKVENWEPVPEDNRVGVWTDDFSNILAVLDWVRDTEWARWLGMDKPQKERDKPPKEKKEERETPEKEE
jgi:hypothetical protein